jgi:hypothetical protein
MNFISSNSIFRLGLGYTYVYTYLPSDLFVV